MAFVLDTFDLLVLGFILIGTLAYFTKGTLWDRAQKPAYMLSNGSTNGSASNRTTRNILERMKQNNKNVAVIYASQTGTAEDFAARLSKEAASRFGLAPMTADVEDYDFENLDQFPENHVACFFVATYGEGEPTDSCAEFWEFINDESVTFSNGEDADSKPLSNLTYVIFGLGNNTYEFFNAMGRNLDKKLTELGAHRLGPYGEGDDGAGTMEEDYLAWKEELFSAWQTEKNLDEKEAVYEPSLEVTETTEISAKDTSVYVGEINKKHLASSTTGEKVVGPFNINNPYPAVVSDAKELFKQSQRNCIHMEFDIADTGIRYTTGDHLAVWPQNRSEEVDLYLQVFGLIDKRYQVIDVKALDPTTKVPFPVPTTYDTVVRYHLEINSAVSRQLLSSIALFAPTEEAKDQAIRLGSDKTLFHKEVTEEYYNTARLLFKLSNGIVWDKVPFSFLIESFQHLQARYYSISSSSLVSPTKISIMAVVEKMKGSTASHELKGVTTNYILNVKEALDGKDSDNLEYTVDGPRGRYLVNHQVRLPIHVRHSNFKLPSNPQKPIIMVGPGTGVAPFRGFILERGQQAAKGTPVGEAYLFFGCRNRTEDYVFENEWKQFTDNDQSFLKVITAFSREGKDKVYVQHRLKQNSQLISDLLDKGAFFYVCGDASKMAHEVQETLIEILQEHKGLSKEKAAEKVKSMKLHNTYQEDVW